MYCHAYMLICIYIYTYKWLCTQIYTNIYIFFVFIYIHKCVLEHVHTHTYDCTYLYKFTYSFMIRFHTPLWMHYWVDKNAKASPRAKISFYKNGVFQGNAFENVWCVYLALVYTHSIIHTQHIQYPDCSIWYIYTCRHVYIYITQMMYVYISRYTCIYTCLCVYKYMHIYTSQSPQQHQR